MAVCCTLQQCSAVCKSVLIVVFLLFLAAIISSLPHPTSCAQAVWTTPHGGKYQLPTLATCSSTSVCLLVVGSVWCTVLKLCMISLTHQLQKWHFSSNSSDVVAYRLGNPHCQRRCRHRHRVIRGCSRNRCCLLCGQPRKRPTPHHRLCSMRCGRGIFTGGWPPTLVSLHVHHLSSVHTQGMFPCVNMNAHVYCTKVSRIHFR